MITPPPPFTVNYLIDNFLKNVDISNLKFKKLVSQLLKYLHYKFSGLVLKNGLLKFKFDVMLGFLLIIPGSFLQITNIDAY